MKRIISVKKFVFLLIILAGIIECNRQQPETQVKTVSAKDSLVAQVQHKDSSILAYVRSINEIQHSIDTLMIDAKVLKRHGEPITENGNIVAQLRTIGNLILKNQKAIADLQRKLKESNEKNDDLADLGENLSKQLNEKDSEITAMQKELVKTKSSLSTLVNQFNDSINIIMQQRAQIGIMKTEGNTVYYITGKENELVKKGLIVKEGGAVGLGRVPVLSQEMSNTGFTKADMTSLHEVPLNGRLVKLVTVHSEKSYRTTPDKLIITDPQDFWSKSKYLVAITQ